MKKAKQTVEAAHDSNAAPVTGDAHTEVAAGHGAPEPLLESPETWITLAFVIFIALAAKYLFPMIGKGLDARAEKIRDQLEQASRLRAEAEQLLATYQRQQDEKLKEAETIIATAQKDAAALRDAAAADLKLALDRRAAQAQEKIARAEAEAIAQIRTQIIDLATAQARESISEALSDEKTDPAIARAIAAISSQIH